MSDWHSRKKSPNKHWIKVISQAFKAVNQQRPVIVKFVDGTEVHCILVEAHEETFFGETERLDLRLVVLNGMVGTDESSTD